MTPSVTALWERADILRHSECLVRSLHRWTGRELIPGVTDPLERSRRLFEAPFVVVSHGTQADPILNYGNRAALDLWEISWDELIRMPSRLTAEAPDREERARLLDRVTRDGYIADYSGVRIARSGKRFRIHQALVWNLVTAEGEPCGQAATFDRWTFLA